jgi:hypothetical protein
MPRARIRTQTLPITGSNSPLIQENVNVPARITAHVATVRHSAAVPVNCQPQVGQRTTTPGAVTNVRVKVFGIAAMMTADQSARWSRHALHTRVREAERHVATAVQSDDGPTESIRRESNIRVSPESPGALD